MNCPFCSKDISAGARYCPFGGNKVDISFEEISRDMADQDNVQKLREKVRESRRILAIAVFLFLVSLIVYIAIPSPRMPDAVPVYRVKAPEIQKLHMEQARLPEFNIPE